MASDDEDAREHSERLGILLVHGIGNHKQGETLNDFAAPIVKWIDRWLASDTRVVPIAGKIAKHVKTKELEGSAAFTGGTLRPPDLPLDTPAHAEARIRIEREGASPVTQAWLFAESWWSPQTLTPRVSPFLLWLITRGPWLVLMHLSQRSGIDLVAFGKEFREARGERVFGFYVRMFHAFLVTVGWLAISFALIVLWCVVSLIALVPIGYVRQQVYKVLILITGVVGDSYVLINDPIQRVAFANSARKALAWLQNQGCTRLAVIAHSQGAAVARDVLMQRGAPQVDLLVTLGPGIAKLDALVDREREDPQVFMWSGAAAPLAFLTVASFLRFYADGESGIDLWGLPIVALCVTWLAVARTWGGVADGLERLKPSVNQIILARQWQRRMRWKDFYATHDPVSNGSLSRTVGAGIRRLVSRPVRVLASALDDHTAYWTSRADFVPRVVAALDHCAGAGLFATPLGVRRVRDARAAYARWLRVLWALRWVVNLSLLVPLFELKRVLALATSLHRFLHRLPVASVSGAVDGADKTIGWIGTQLWGRDVEGSGVTAVVLLAAIAALVLHILTRVVTYWWQQVATLQLTRVFIPSKDDGLMRFGRWLLMGVVVTLGLLPAAISLVWTFFPEATSWESIRKAIGMFITLSLMGLYGLGVWACVAATRELWTSYREARQATPRPTAWRALKSVPDPFVVPFLWLSIGVGCGYWLAQNRYASDLLVPAVLIAALATTIVFARRFWLSRSGRRGG